MASKRNFKIESGKLSERTNMWASLISVCWLDYPQTYCIHTAVDKLLNGNLEDGKSGLQLACEFQADNEWEGVLEETLKSCIAIGKENGVAMLQECTKSPYEEVSKCARKILADYKASRYKYEEQLEVIKGPDEEVKAEINRRIRKLWS